MNHETPHRIPQKRLFSIYAKIAVHCYLQIWWIGEFVVAFLVPFIRANIAVPQISLVGYLVSKDIYFPSGEDTDVGA
jgi:hypothetical protein